MAKQRTENVPPAALWKDTFSDLMNLLLCFFVLMFAMSNIDSHVITGNAKKQTTISENDVVIVSNNLNLADETEVTPN